MHRKRATGGTLVSSETRSSFGRERDFSTSFGSLIVKRDDLGHIPNTFMYFDGLKDSYSIACIIEFLVNLSENKYSGTKLDINQQI